MILSVDDLIRERPHDAILLDGAFDPLHAGHLAYIHAALKTFPKNPMVVAVASDDDIRAKGREPLFDQVTRATIVASVKGVVRVVLKDRPTEQVIAALAPYAYIKGKDWDGELPEAQITVCAMAGTQVVYLGDVLDSSSDRLRAWALKDADASLDRLEAFIAAQGDVSPETFDTEYFTGDWRSTAPPYTFEGRKQAEGRHPKIVKECFDGLTVLDVGCGPGYFVRMLRELGMDAGGIDPSADAIALSNGLADRVVRGQVRALPPKIAHVAICREVAEHVPVADIPALVCDLFRVARKFVYITTRFQDGAVFDATTDFETDPTHVSCLSQPFLRSLCVLNGGKRRRDLETKLDHAQKGRVLVYETSQ